MVRLAWSGLVAIVGTIAAGILGARRAGRLCSRRAGHGFIRWGLDSVVVAAFGPVTLLALRPAARPALEEAGP